MRCPKCGKDGAYLWNEDGITDFGDQLVQIMHDCQLDGIIRDPECVAVVKITVMQIRPIKVGE
ncbi:MAG: hypothetical protein ACTSSP_10425 [Candidatus Asgardarchaeia archaeon]